MVTALLCLGHSATDRLENLGSPQFRNEETKRVSLRGTLADVAPGARAALDEPSELEFAERPIDGDPGCSKHFHQLVLAGKPLADTVFSGSNRFFQAIKNLLILGSTVIRNPHRLMIQV